MKVSWNGQEFTGVQPGSGIGDLIAFEAQFGVPAERLSPDATDADGNPIEQEMSWIAFLIFRGMRRAGQIPKDVAFDDWVDDLDMVEEEEADKVAVLEGQPSVDPSVPVPPPISPPPYTSGQG